MKAVFLILLSISLISGNHALNRNYRNVHGTYEDKKFNHRLRINCDNTAESWLWGDKNEPISGQYSITRDTLILKVNLSEFDTLFSTEWNGVIKFKIRKDQLIRVIDVYDLEFEEKINKTLRKYPFLRTEKKKC